MKLSNEQIKQLHEKLDAASNSEEAAKAAQELGIDFSAEGMGKVLENVGGVQAMSENALEKISGGTAIDLPPHVYNAIKDAYEDGGPSLAVATCIFYILSPICFNVFVYNYQPGIHIDYLTGKSWIE